MQLRLLYPSLWLLLLPGLLLRLESSAQQLTAYSKLCKTLELTHLDYETHLNASRLRQRLAQMVNGCQYINGDLIVNWIGSDRITGSRLGGDIRDMATDFLDSIIEITGQLRLVQVNLARLELRNLRAIRGHGRPAIDLDQCPHPVQLVLPRLAAIAKGGVNVISVTDQNLYCHVTRTVNWPGLFQSPGLQRLNYSGVSGCAVASRPVASCDCAGVVCHPACGAALGCWAGDAAACQTSGRCRRRACGTCYVDARTGEEECCHSACLGGCSGPSAKDCFSCRIASYNGECREGCPTEVYDAATAKVIVTKEPMVQVGNICMRTCPATFVLDSRRRYCLSECPDGELPVDGNCTACSEQSGRPCRICESHERRLVDDLARNFSNCTVWKLESSFTVDGTVMSEQAWSSLASARIVYASTLTIKRTQNLASNLSILHRLIHVSGDVIISQLTATHVGLSGLRSAKRLFFYQVSGLCRAWFPLDYLRGSPPYAFGMDSLEFADNSSAKCAGAACHSLCRGGCWGPGPELCVACANVSVNGVCYSDCRQAGRYSAAPSGECLPCHLECGHPGGCSGPDADQCAACRHNLQDGICVPACSSHLEADAAGVCYSASSVRLGLLAGGLALLVLVLVAAGVLAWLYYQRRLHKYDMVDLDEHLGDASNPSDMVQLLIINDDDLVKQKEIGSGAFGTVYKGMLRSETDRGRTELPVAIKVLRGSNPKLGQELLNEAGVLARVRHPHCVRLVALCLTEEVQLVTNLMPRGCLLDFLRARQAGISATRMLTWALQVAEGMAYLESVNIVHRDLAARNVLLKTPDDVKITDFGLARLLQNSEHQLLYTSGAMPVKWLGLECFESGVFSHKSDVWSYGVLLWEICSYGEAPYKPYRISSVDDISGLLRKGVRLNQPPVCSVDFYNIMLSCWLPNPSSRPDFTDLMSTMKDCVAAPGQYIAYGPGMEDDDAFDDPDAIVHIRDASGQRPSAVTSKASTAVGSDEYTPMSVLEPDEKDSLMRRDAERRPAPNNYVNDPSRHRQQAQQQRNSSQVQTRRAPQAPKTPVPPPISTLPSAEGYLEPIRSPKASQQSQQHQQHQQQQQGRHPDEETPADSEDYLVPREDVTSQPVALDDDYLAPTKY